MCACMRACVHASACVHACAHVCSCSTDDHDQSERSPNAHIHTRAHTHKPHTPSRTRRVHQRDLLQHARRALAALEPAQEARAKVGQALVRLVGLHGQRVAGRPARGRGRPANCPSVWMEHFQHKASQASPGACGLPGCTASGRPARAHTCHMPHATRRHTAVGCGGHSLSQPSAPPPLQPITTITIIIKRTSAPPSRGKQPRTGPWWARALCGTPGTPGPAGT